MKQQLAQHAERVLRFLVRLTGDPHAAEELAQEALLRAWRNRRQLRDERAARVWLFRIAVNLWKDRRRSARRAGNRAAAEVDEQPSRAPGPPQRAVQREDVQRALRALDDLPQRQREVLYLRACGELSVPEIAQVLGISPGSVRSNLSLARKLMRAKLADLYPRPTEHPCSEQP